MTNTKKTPAKTALTNVLTDLLHKKPFHKISVNELCETAQLSRSAFYANFEDKYQLLSYCLHTKTNELHELTESRSPKELLAVILDFLQTEDRFFYNAFASDPSRETAEILYQLFNEHFTVILEERMSQGHALPGPVEAVSSFYIGGLTTMVLRWIDGNYNIPKEELVACQLQLLKDIL